MNFDIERHASVMRFYYCQRYFDKETGEHFYSIHESIDYLDYFYKKKAKIFPDWRRLKTERPFLTINVLNKVLDEWHEGHPPKLYINRKLPDGWLKKLNVFFNIESFKDLEYHPNTSCWTVHDKKAMELSKYIKSIYDEEKEINIIMTFKNGSSIEGYGKIHIDNPGNFEKLIETIEIMKS